MTTEPLKAEEGAKREPCRPLEEAVGNSVLRALGRPVGLHHVQTRKVFGDHYRVNVYVGKDAASARVGYSYFVTANATGEVVSCCPAIPENLPSMRSELAPVQREPS